MTEYINKAEVMQYLDERRYTITMKDVSEMSTIDIVRCHECKHQDGCAGYNTHDGDWFCADGERSNNG